MRLSNKQEISNKLSQRLQLLQGLKLQKISLRGDCIVWPTIVNLHWTYWDISSSAGVSVQYIHGCPHSSSLIWVQWSICMLPKRNKIGNVLEKLHIRLLKGEDVGDQFLCRGGWFFIVCERRGYNRLLQPGWMSAVTIHWSQHHWYTWTVPRDMQGQNKIN